MIIKLYRDIISILIRNMLNFPLNTIAIILAGLLNITSHIFFPFIFLSIFDGSYFGIFALINNKLFSQIYIQINQIFIYKLVNATIWQFKKIALKSYINSNDNVMHELGKIKRMPDHIYRITQASFNIANYIAIILIQLYIMKNYLFYIIPATLIYLSLFQYGIKKWIPILKDAYTADDKANTQSILSIQYKNQFINSEDMINREVNKNLKEEFNLYNKQTVYIRSFSLFCNILLYTYFSIIVYAGLPTLPFKIIITGTIFINCLTRISNSYRMIIGFLYGVRAKFLDQIQLQSIKFSIINANKINFQYPDGKHVLHDISFQINPNEWIQITGQNGSGKTTLCKILSGSIIPNSGQISNGTFLLNADNQQTWKKHVLYRGKNLQVFSYELDQLKQNKKWLSAFPEYINLLEQNKFSEGENHFLSLSALITYPKPWLIILDESLDCIDQHLRERLYNFLTMHFENGIIISQFMDKNLKNIKLEKKLS